MDKKYFQFIMIFDIHFFIMKSQYGRIFYIDILLKLASYHVVLGKNDDFFSLKLFGVKTRFNMRFLDTGRVVSLIFGFVTPFRKKVENRKK